MRLALLGYGRMGRKIAEIAASRGHEIVVTTDENTGDWDLGRAELAIDFSTPAVAFGHISRCLQEGIPIVSGTTGWLGQWEQAVNLCREKQGAFLYASNFSLGVNLFFELNRRLAQLMNDQTDYQISLLEVHHIHKLDSPSGTAISLAEDIIRKSGQYRDWQLEEVPPGPRPDQIGGTPAESVNSETSTIPIYSQRKDEVPGTHVVTYESAVDRIRIEHEAFSRDGFALGAVIGAEWLLGRTGVFSMKDVLGI